MSIAKIESRADLEALLAADDADLAGIDAAGVELKGIDLRDRDLSGALLRYTDLSGADLRGCNLRHANLRHARLLEADLRYADLSGADLGHATLAGAILGETKMLNVNVDGIQGVSTEIFFPLSLLDTLLKRPGVELKDDELLIPGDGIEHYHVVPAFRIVEVEGGEVGDRKLLGKVLSQKQIRERGGEVAGSSVILGDHAYRCEEGYIGVPEAGKVRAAAQPAKDDEQADDASDMDLLKDFLLSKLE